MPSFSLPSFHFPTVTSLGVDLLILLAVLTVMAGVLSFAATGWVLRLLNRFAVMDNPNARSSHARPTPRGGGLGVVPVVVLLWAVSALAMTGRVEWPLAGALIAAAALAALSFLDDLVSLPAATRLVAMAAAVAGGLWLMPVDALVFQGLLPIWADRVAAGFLWLWFVNLYNFMDGIDGITGVETATIGIGGAIVAWYVATPTDMALALTLAAAAIGFLAWNWHPARLFLGDVGSVPIGYLAGFLLLRLAADGAWIPALILPAYYLADATITLVRRLIRGEKVWQAHRQHFYQRSVIGGRSHSETCHMIVQTNALLVGLAWFAMEGLPWPALAAAVLGVALLLRRLARKPI